MDKCECACRCTSDAEPGNDVCAACNSGSCKNAKVALSGRSKDACGCIQHVPNQDARDLLRNSNRTMNYRN